MATHQIAQGIAKLGRNGDSTLVHMQPHEVAGLQALAKANGTSLTINPETGLPEAFSLGGFFKSFLPSLVGLGVGAAGGPMTAGILAGAATGALTNKKNPLMGGVMGGLGGYGGFGIGDALKSMGAANVAANPEAFQNAASLEASKAAGQTGVGNSIADGNAILNQTATDNLRSFGADQNMLAVDAAKNNLANSWQGTKDLVTGQEGAWGNFKQALNPTGPAVSDLSAGMKLGMPVAGGVLGGLEPSDLGYGTNLAASGKDKYDPYATLNLNTNTGLKLYAQGGPISFADGGDAMKGGGADAMQGAGMLPLDVSDINARYGYDPTNSGLPRGMQGNTNTAFSGPTGGIGFIGQNSAMPSVPVPVLGLFADNDQIEAARTAYESQLAAAMAGRGGMGSTANAPQLAKSMGTLAGSPVNKQPTGIAGLNSMGSTAATADTAPTAETALSRLNLNKQYANGGTVQTGGLQDLYQTSDNPPMNPSLSRDGYGLGRLQAMADGGVAGYAKGGYLDGPGDGMSDSIPATIEGKQPARLADGEFVIPADVVSHLGNGSTKAGSQRLYGMLDKVRKARTGTKKQGKQINPNKFMPA